MQWQYFCKQCGYERQGLLPVPWGIGGYAWACPECKSHDIDSRPVLDESERPANNTGAES